MDDAKSRAAGIRDATEAIAGALDRFGAALDKHEPTMAQLQRESATILRALGATAADATVAYAAQAADFTEARAEIAALRGLPEGAVSSGWTWEDDGGFWEKRGQHFAIVVGARVDEVRWYLARRGNPLNDVAPTLRDAMRAADKAAGVTS